MKAMQVLHAGRFPAEGAIIVPSRLNEAEAAELERSLAGRRVVRFGVAELTSGALDAVRQAVDGRGFGLFMPPDVESWPGSQ